MTIRILQGDALELLPALDAGSVDAIVTDPPYHLTTRKKGGSGAASLNEGSPAGRSRIGTGFMGMGWDGGDVAMRPETWAACLRVAKPGAHMLVFGGSRTFHRVWCAVEDAGWEIRDTIMWLHGEGFPKSSNQRGEWEGWGTALKPAFEPILMARKPMIGTVPENLERYRTGALNIGVCRVLAETMPPNTGAGGLPRRAVDEERGPGVVNQPHENGRWPANVMHDGSDEVVTLFPATAGAFAPVRGTEPSSLIKNAYAPRARIATAHHGDSGSASRFFWCPKASRSDRNDGLEGMPRKAVNWSSGEQSPGTFQSPNTDRQNENHHPTVKPTALMRYLCRLVTAPGGTVLDPFMGSGSTGKAAMLEGFSFVGIEIDTQYIEIAKRRINADAPLFAEVA